MAEVDRILLVNLSQPAVWVVDLLREARRRLRGVYLLDVPHTPARPPDHIVPVAPATGDLVLPVTKLSLVRPPLRRIHAILFTAYICRLPGATIVSALIPDLLT